VRQLEALPNSTWVTRASAGAARDLRADAARAGDLD
jgi:hypothetical protein